MVALRVARRRALARIAWRDLADVEATVRPLVAFAPLARPSGPVLLAILGVTAAIVRWLWPHAGELRAPVLVYAVTIAVMLWLALGVDRGFLDTTISTGKVIGPALSGA